MIDIQILRNDVERVKENIKKKFQDHKLQTVDRILEEDSKKRALQGQIDALRAKRNSLSAEIGKLKGQKNGQLSKQEIDIAVDNIKLKVEDINTKIALYEKELDVLDASLKKDMLTIPNFIADEVPIGKDDSENVERKIFLGQPLKEFDLPYHIDILEKVCGIDLESARKATGAGFYYLMGDIARLHSAILSYARDFMINKGFLYCIPPYLLRGEVAKGVLPFEEMDAMMYKIEGEDMYLIGTSEHSILGRYFNTILQEEELPVTITSYSPCFRKEKGAHGLEERGIYRIHQFEKQEMIVLCRPEESNAWFEKMYTYTVELFTSLEIPCRTLECCSGDLGDLKYRSIDVEAWSPRQKKYFEVGSCSNLTDAQARRLGIRYKSKNGNQFLHTLNNTVVAPPRMLIAYVENHVNRDGSINIPKVLQPYMGGNCKIEVK